MRCSAAVLDCTFGHVHRVVATLVRVRGAHPTVDRFACVQSTVKTISIYILQVIWPTAAGRQIIVYRDKISDLL